jgi:hypothetical protein
MCVAWLGRRWWRDRKRMMMDEGPQGPTDWEIDMGDIKCVGLPSWLSPALIREPLLPGLTLQLVASTPGMCVQQVATTSCGCGFCQPCNRVSLLQRILLRIVKRPDGTDWELGTGNFGKVLRGIRDDVQPVAVKSMFRRDRSMEEAFIREIAMMKCILLS